MERTTFPGGNMSHHRRLVLLVTVLVTLFAAGCAQDKKSANLDAGETENLIYGEDNRVQAVNASSQHQALARSTVALVKSTSLSIPQSQFADIKLKTQSYKTARRLCASEPFVNEQIAAFCSGSLIAPNRILTAGHCIRHALDCADTKFVFDFKTDSQGRQSNVVKRNNLYSCKKIVSRVFTEQGADFAVIELDKNVVGRTPLEMASASDLRSGDTVVVMGHPAGLPLKVADGGIVRSVGQEHFVASLDTYGGNSGSAVFNSRTLKIEGVLVRGDTDFVSNGSCYVSNRCTQEGCHGEDVTKIDQVLASLSTSSFRR